MDNDFVKGMEMLIRCKQYIEARIEALQLTMERMDNCGKDPRALQAEIDRLKKIIEED